MKALSSDKGESYFRVLIISYEWVFILLVSIALITCILVFGQRIGSPIRLDFLLDIR